MRANVMHDFSIKHYRPDKLLLKGLEIMIALRQVSLKDLFE